MLPYAFMSGFLVLSNLSALLVDMHLGSLERGAIVITVDCHSCSSRKALRIALVLNLGKPYCQIGAKPGKKADTFSLARPSQPQSLLQLKDVVLSTAIHLKRTSPTPVLTPSGVSSRSVSPFSRRPSPPRSTSPIPSTSGLELQRSTKKTQEAMTLATKGSTKSKAAKEVIKSLTAQLKDLAGRLPPSGYDSENIRPAYLPNGVQYPDLNGEHYTRAESLSGSGLASVGLESSLMNRTETDDYPDVKLPNPGQWQYSCAVLGVETGGACHAVDEAVSPTEVAATPI
ncbi:hypothetical protein VNO78_22724 [Psophocarpus tetragonolobus]|uniref:Transcription factor BREVIS RADIX N-terminal domain-containing protein n=1 Tax=Psophocarpus tetragonolobus TaxID=3891 RepID=A0AAN9S3N5_PSOTE